MRTPGSLLLVNLRHENRWTRPAPHGCEQPVASRPREELAWPNGRHRALQHEGTARIPQEGDHDAFIRVGTGDRNSSMDRR